MSRNGALALRATLAVVSALVAAPAFADTVTFKDGWVVHGRIIEESDDDLILAFPTGSMTLLKNDIGSFTRDKDDGSVPAVRRRPWVSGELTHEWTRPKDASPSEVVDLDDVHDRLEAAFAALGPSRETRLRRYEPTDADRAALAAATSGFDGSISASTFDSLGLKAVGTLAEALDSGNSLARRASAATALADVVTRGDVADAKWLLREDRVPERLVTMLGAAGNVSAGAARDAANRTLERISGQNFNWPDGSSPDPTDAQRAAAAKWRQWADQDAEPGPSRERTRTAERQRLEGMWDALEDPVRWRQGLDAAITTLLGAPRRDLATATTADDRRSIVEATARLRAALKTIVGPSIADLSAHDALSSEERLVVQRWLHELGDSKRRGGAQLRRNAAEALVALGAKAVAPLASALESDDLRLRWDAAVALGMLATGSDRRDVLALAFALGAPENVATLLNDASDERSSTIRLEANRALEEISGRRVGWPEGTSKDPTPDEVAAAARWHAWVDGTTADFDRREAARERAREGLTALLGRLTQPRDWRAALAQVPVAIEKARARLSGSSLRAPSE